MHFVSVSRAIGGRAWVLPRCDVVRSSRNVGAAEAGGGRVLAVGSRPAGANEGAHSLVCCRRGQCLAPGKLNTILGGNAAAPGVGSNVHHFALGAKEAQQLNLAATG